MQANGCGQWWKKLEQNTLKIATKYVNSAKHYFEAKGQQIEIIKLYGAMELAPMVGLAHCIVDLVDTGNTLKANGLVPLEHIEDISSRLVVNAASFKTKNAQIKTWVKGIEKNLWSPAYPRNKLIFKKSYLNY